MDWDRLWAPWRMSYIRGEAGDDRQSVASMRLLEGANAECFMCQAAVAADSSEVRQAADRARLVIERTPDTLVMLNRYPYSNGHLLVAPRQHRGELDEIAVDVHDAIQERLRHFVGLLRRLMQPDGFNIGLNLGRAAGAGVPGHLHWHVVPRWNGDHNFMTPLAGTRVIPQALEELYQLLREEIQDEG